MDNSSGNQKDKLEEGMKAFFASQRFEMWDEPLYPKEEAWMPLSWILGSRKTRADGTVYTKPDLETRKLKARRKNKLVKAARKHNRSTKGSNQGVKRYDPRHN